MKNILNSFSLKVLFATLFFSGYIFAAGEADFPENYYDKVAIFLVLVIIFGFLALAYFEGRQKPVTEKKKSVLWAKIKQYLTKSTPIEKEEEILLADHNYDGIRELDNRIPPWFSGLFYVTILFAIWYMIYYHVTGAGQLQEQEYAEEVRLAEIKKAELIKSGALINEETVTLLTDKAALDEGKEIFTKNCVACHAADGGGLVGPNLTDDYWIHGGGIKNVFKVIKYGVTKKGMLVWQNQLNPNQMQAVASYVISLHGTKPANPKAPEGEMWKE